MTAHEIHALSGAYAVDALDDDERARFEEHLASCAECRAEVASMQEAAARFGETTATAPPPALRDRLLADIQGVRPLPPLSAPEEPADDELAARRRPRWANALVAAAAVVAVVAGGAVVWQQLDDTTTQAPVSAAQRIITADDAKQVTLDFPDGASATIYRSAALGRAALVTQDMPAAPSGRVYQLWFQKDGEMVPAGLMPRGSNQSVVLDGTADDATAVGITVEPAGGSEHPTTAPIAVFDLGQAT